MTAVRLLVLATVWLLASGTLSLAKDESMSTAGTTAPDEATQTAEENSTAEGDRTPGILIVPDVRNLPYVFAKGTLEDAGFAWRVEGSVEAYAVNLVAKQSVEPGTKVVDTGAPTIVLTLKRNPDYEEVGLPDDSSPYPGTKLQLAYEGPGDSGQEDSSQEGASETGAENGGESATAGAADDAADQASAPSTDAENAAETVGPADGEELSEEEAAQIGARDADIRPPAFLEPGAPPEPLDEMPLPKRARLLGAWLAKQQAMGPAAWDHYTYQHAWVVTGAMFGWWRGAEALEILIGVDERLQERFGLGVRLEREARAALAEVLRKAQQ